MTGALEIASVHRPFSGEVTISDPSLHEVFLQPLDIICQPTTRNYSLHLRYLLTRHCIIYQESFQFGVTATGALPPSYYSFCVPVQVAQEASFGKQKFCSRTIAISSAGALHAVIPPKQRHITLLIHKDFLDLRLSRLARQQLERCVSAHQIKASDSIISRFASWLLRIIDVQKVWAVSQPESALQQIEDDLGTWLNLLVTNIDEVRSPPIKRLLALSRAMNWLNEKAAQERVSVHDLRRAAAVSQRTLERAFLDNFHQNPREYLLKRRLHNVRRLLVGADKNDLLIKEAAIDCGFYDLARFSHYYRRYFFESPSETLSRPALRLPASKTLTDAWLQSK